MFLNLNVLILYPMRRNSAYFYSVNKKIGLNKDKEFEKCIRGRLENKILCLVPVLTELCSDVQLLLIYINIPLYACINYCYFTFVAVLPIRMSL